MEDIKENLAINISKYRKALKLTQAELAQKLNYSDKAISKWERGESVPDLYVLKELADIYCVSIDTLISTPKKEKITSQKTISKKRIIISTASAVAVWLIAVVYYAYIGILFPSINHPWLSFIYATAGTFLILFILTSVWGKTISRAIILSLLLWTLLLSIYLSIIFLLPSPPNKLWMLFLIGIPAQVLIILWLVYKKVK